MVGAWADVQSLQSGGTLLLEQMEMRAAVGIQPEMIRVKRERFVVDRLFQADLTEGRWMLLELMGKVVGFC